jgi:hypothetical protein
MIGFFYRLKLETRELVLENKGVGASSSKCLKTWSWSFLELAL